MFAHLNALSIPLLPTLVRHCAQKRNFAVAALAFSLAACGGGSSGESQTDLSHLRMARATNSAMLNVDSADGAEEWIVAETPGVPSLQGKAALVNVPVSQAEAVRLANQTTFGANEAVIAQIRAQGPLVWIARQMATSRSGGGTLRPEVAPLNLPPTTSFGQRKPMVFADVSTIPTWFSSGGTGAIDQFTSNTSDFCDSIGETCWRDWSSSTPLLWDFYRRAVSDPDQLRQRVGWALQQILVVSNLEVFGTYGLRNYNNALLDQAFGNYREVLRKVALSPVMGDYLNNVNNDKAAPNENFARELLQLFSLGTCQLNVDGSLKGGKCEPTYENEMVRNYAYALTGWTYPKGGASYWGCWPQGANCRFYNGEMAPVLAFHDASPRTLLSGVSLPNGHNPQQALDAVLNSLMVHPNMAPFIGRQMIQHLVSSNPSPAYVQRVANAFVLGRFQGFGSGQRGDMKATVAAVLLDTEARSASPVVSAGRLREPAQFFTGVLRALNGTTDGDVFGWWWGEELRQHAFRSPSVFNFYPPDYPVAGTALVGPAFALHSTNAALERVNYVNYLVFWGGTPPSSDMPSALGTSVNLNPFLVDALEPEKLVDRLSLLAFGSALPSAARTAVITAVNAYTPQNSPSDYQLNRVRQAAYLIFASPHYQIVR